MAGMRSTKEGVQILVEAAVAELDESSRLDVLVTHDSILAMFLGRVFSTHGGLDPWPQFLEGAFLRRDGRSVAVTWRGEPRRRASASGAFTVEHAHASLERAAWRTGGAYQVSPSPAGASGPPRARITHR